MIHYLIEFRFFGKAKYRIRKLIYEVKKKFKLGYKKEIPHITLVGPFKTNNERKLIRDFNNLCSKAPIMEFEVSGFNTFKDNKVVYIDIKPSKELNNFRWSLSNTLRPYCKLSLYDYQKNFYYHATIARKLGFFKFWRIKNYINKKAKLNFKHIMVRATLLKGRRILREYDFLLRRPLIRRLALNKRILNKTMSLLQDLKKKKIINKNK